MESRYSSLGRDIWFQICSVLRITIEKESPVNAAGVTGNHFNRSLRGRICRHLRKFSEVCHKASWQLEFWLILVIAVCAFIDRLRPSSLTKAVCETSLWSKTFEKHMQCWRISGRRVIIVIVSKSVMASSRWTELGYSFWWHENKWWYRFAKVEVSNDLKNV